MEYLQRDSLGALYRCLYAAYGPQHWWPARSSFEMMAGAILTQHTAWRGAALAVAALREAHLLTPRALAACDPVVLHGMLRPAGCFRLKAECLRSLCAWLERRPLRILRPLPAARLRAELLAVRGIGPETADAILLYAFEHPVFVVDAYARRLFRRLGWISSPVSDAALRAAVQESLPSEAGLFNELHALIVRHGKESCAGGVECRHCAVEHLLCAGRAA